MSDVDAREPGPTIIGLVAAKWRMTEGQVYTVVLAALAVVLLTLTGLPNAHKTDRSAPVVTETTVDGQP